MGIGERKMNLYDLGYLLAGVFGGFVIHRIINEILYKRFKGKNIK